MSCREKIAFCILRNGQDDARLQGVRGGLASHGVGEDEVFVAEGWGELGDLARSSGREILAVLDADVALTDDWFECLTAHSEDFDVLTSRDRSGSVSRAGEVGTVLKAYVARAVCDGSASPGESFESRCRRFGFRVAELGPAALQRAGAKAMAPFTDLEADFGLNVFGFLSGNLGMGVTARHYLRNLIDHGVPVQPVEVLVGGGRSHHDQRYGDVWTTVFDQVPYPINFFILNPLDIDQLLEADCPALEGWEDRINICLPFWELPRIPPRWISILNRMEQSYLMITISLGSLPAA